jgi:hypothetical protein
MEKQIFKLTDGLIHMSRIMLFILIVMPISIKLSSSDQDGFQVFNRALSSLGFFCLLCWIYSIGYKSNANLKSTGVQLKPYKYFALTFILSILSLVILIIQVKEIQMNWNNIKVHYLTPMYLVISFVLFLSITAIISAKALVSAELKREAEPNEYLGTFFLMIFAIVGVWSIQPRIQKIN